LYSYHKLNNSSETKECETKSDDVTGDVCHSSLSKKAEKRLANKLAKKAKRTTVHQGVTKRQRVRIAEVIEKMRQITGSSEDVPREELPGLVRKLFLVEKDFRNLVEDLGPKDIERGCESLASCAVRPELYQQKMLPQAGTSL